MSSELGGLEFSSVIKGSGIEDGVGFGFGIGNGIEEWELREEESSQAAKTVEKYEKQRCFA